MLVLYNEALQAVATGQSYEINGRRMTRADLREIRDTIEWLEARIERAGENTAGLGVTSFGDPT